MPTVTGRKRVGVASAATPGAWRQFAVCFGLGLTDMFHSDKADDQKAAKKVCESCQARKACLEFALQTKQEQGVWGGATPEERRKIRRQAKG